MRRAPTARGFTLVELMTVVVIVGILATIGIGVFREHANGSRPVEAIAMIQSIRVAEERWKAENLTYLNVSGGGWYPAAPTAKTRRAFYNAGVCSAPFNGSDDCGWKLLNPTVTGPTEFGFMVNAGPPNVVMTKLDSLATPTDWPGWPANTEYWYVIQAIADADGDGVYAKYVASSLNGEVFRENEGE